jgi:tryptophanyl-tRNA synthetase
VTIFSFILHLSIILSEKESLFINRWFYLLIYLPSAVFIYAYGINDQLVSKLYNFIFTEGGWVNISARSFWDFGYNFYYLAFSACALVLLWKWGRKTREFEKKKIVTLLIFSIAAAVILGSVTEMILNTFTYPGELSRMTQFKDKSAKHADNVNMGLMDYPVLMAADILLYQTALVPVGQDQKQHLQLTRDIAIRFNNRYSPTFTVPEPYILKESAKIMDLNDPTKKMSKSDENSVLLSDDKDTIVRKFKHAVTDSGSEIKYFEDKKGISNLLTIYSAFTDKTIEEAEKDFEGKGYGDFKIAVGETVADKLKPVQNEKAKLLQDKEYINGILQRGAENAYRTARKTLSKVYRKIGFYSLDK